MNIRGFSNMSGVSGIVRLCLAIYVFSCLQVFHLCGSVTLASIRLLQQHVMARLVACSCLATGKVSMYYTQDPVSNAATWPTAMVMQLCAAGRHHWPVQWLNCFVYNGSLA